MASFTTKLSIFNRALQHLGQPVIANPNENSTGAKSLRAAYESVLLASLRSHVWKFAIKRASLAEDAAPPLFGKAHRYQLPGDFVRLAPEETTYVNPSRRDWEIEGNYIISDDSAPLKIRYVSSGITESDFDALFAEALALDLAVACCEQITNSNTKLANLLALSDSLIKQARKTNSIESAPVKSPTCSWISARE